MQGLARLRERCREAPLVTAGPSGLLTPVSLREAGTKTCVPIKQAGRDPLAAAVRAPELLIGTRAPAEAARAANGIWLAVN